MKSTRAYWKIWTLSKWKNRQRTFPSRAAAEDYTRYKDHVKLVEIEQKVRKNNARITRNKKSIFI